MIINNFEDFYQSISNQEELSKLHESSFKKYRRNKIIAFIILVLFSFIVVYFMRDYIFNNNGYFSILPKLFILIFLATMYMIIFFVITMQGTSKYKDEYKDKVIDKLFKNFFDNVDYVPKKSLAEDIYNEGKYKRYFNRFSADDFVDATIDDKYRITMANIETRDVEEVKDKDGNIQREDTIVFKGIFAKIRLTSSIDSEIRIKENSLFTQNKLEMDYTEFENFFDVESKNEILGMRILTHDVMERLIYYRKNLGYNYDIFISNNNMYLRFHVGEMFEANMKSKSVIDKNQLLKFYNCVNLIYSLSKYMSDLLNNI